MLSIARQSFLFSSLITFCLLSASPTQAGTIRHDDQDFDGDAPDDELYVGLAGDYPSVGWFNNSNGSGASCSWTLIGSHWALTAAHCFEVGENPDNLSFALGTPDWNTAATYTRGAVQTYVHPRWKSELFIYEGWDIALVRLDEDIEGIEPSKFNRTKVESGEIFTYVGYGQTGTGQGAGSDEPAGTKRAGRNIIDDRRRDGRVLVNDFDSPTNPDLNQLGSSNPIFLEYNTAPGDSGGGGFLNVNGEERLGSIVSYSREGDVIFGGEREDNYGELDFHVSVRQFDHWIDATITQYANEHHWTAGSGDFYNGSNWDQSTAPGVDDTAVFNRDATYTVDASAAIMRRMVFRDGNVTFDTDGTVVYADFDPDSDIGGDSDPSESMIVGVTELDDPTIRFTGNGVVQPARVRIAELPGSFGRIEVDADTEVLGDMIKVGVGGEGEVALDNGNLYPTELRVGNNTGATGDVTATNGSDVHLGTLVVGHYGQGTVSLDSGSTMQTDDWAVIGRHESSSGSGVELDDADWTADHEVRIGKGAFGYVRVRNGSRFDASGHQVYLGFDYLSGLLRGGGSMTVAGMGSTFLAGDWIVGWGDTGTAGVRDGGSATVTNLIVGGADSSESSELNVGAGGSVDINNNAFVGYAGQGEANIAEGAQVNQTSGTTIVGHMESSEGVINITGANGSPSRWDANGLIVGEAGEGSVFVEAGGELSVFNPTTIAQDDTFVGSEILVRGQDSLLDAGSITVADHGVGGLAAHDGGAINAAGSLRVADKPQSIGQVTIRNAMLQARSTTFGDEGLALVSFENQADVDLGDTTIGEQTDGRGLVDVETGANVFIDDDLMIGQATESRGELNVRGLAEDESGMTPSTLVVDDTIEAAVIGQAGSAAMTVTNGGQAILNGRVSLGTQAGGTGELTVGGAAGFGENQLFATVDVDRFLQIGVAGQAKVTIQTGGVVHVNTYTNVGSMNYDGNGRLVMEGGVLESGSLNVADNEVLQFRTDYKNGLIRVDGGEDGVGSFNHRATDFHIDGTLTGGVARFEMLNDVEADLGGNDLIVGNGNEGELLVRDGARFPTHDTTVGWTSDAVGRVTVRNGEMPHTGNLTVGRAGFAQFDVELGGQVSVDGDATLAQMTGSEGQLVVSGTHSPDLLTLVGSRFEVTGEANGSSGSLMVGEQGQALLQIVNGGRADVAGDVELARGGDSSAAAIVAGSAEGAVTDLQARLDVGGNLVLSQNFDEGDLITLPAPSGSASLFIGTGGVVNVEGETNMGTFQSDSAIVSIGGGTLRTTDLNTASGTLLFNFGEVYIEGGELTGQGGQNFTLGGSGADGASLLEINAGGQFHLNNAQRGSDGLLIDPGDLLTVGQGAYGRLNVLDGSHVTSGQAIIGDGTGISSAPQAVIGDGPIILPGGPSFGGEAVVDGADSQWTIGHTLNIGAPVTETYDPIAANNGRLRISNGGHVAVTDAVTVNPESVLLLDDGRIDADGVFLHPGPFDETQFVAPGVLAGSGTVGGPVINVGTVDVGNSPGLLTVEGDYLQQFSVGDISLEGTLLIELGGLVPGQSFDLLTVTDNAELSGTLGVSIIDDFVPSVGDSFAFLEAGSVIGQFDNAALPMLPGGKSFELVYSPTNVSLLVVPEPATALLLLPGVLLLRRRPR